MKMYVSKRVFIASPSDLNEERKVFVDIISEVNIIKAHALGIHLEPLGWEDTLPGRGRPQELINSDLANSDLFVMMLWKKWGTPTGEFSSGTEEEFHVASALNLKNSRPDIWVFFKSISEEESSSRNEDIAKVIEFRKHIEKDNFCLYKTFDTISNWEKKFRNLLCKWLDILHPVAVKQMPGDLPKGKILIEISFVDWVRGDSKAEIYFTLKDSGSFNEWCKLNIDQKKQYLYDQLYQHLYLIIGSDPYTAVMRYKFDNNCYILLGMISFKYGASLEQSKIFIPLELNQIITQEDMEKRLIDFFILGESNLVTSIRGNGSA